MKNGLKVGIVVVSYGHDDVLPMLIHTLSSQMRVGDKLVVVDNHPNGKGAESVRDSNFVHTAVKASNKGFSSGCNIGAAKIINFVDVLVFINPDTIPSDSVLDTIRTVDYAKYAAAMPLLTLPDGTVNSAGNVVHISGLSWCDGYGRRVDEFSYNQNIAVLSGACMAISKKWWKKLDGMDECYFMYYEDTDLSTRIGLLGGRMSLLVNSTIEHDYDYKKGAYKWLYLERNRPIYILRTWPTSVIVVLLPQLIVVELGLFLVAILQKRVTSKIRAYGMFMGALPSTLKQRRTIQGDRKITGYEFLSSLAYKLDTPVLGGVGKNKLIEFIFRTYYKLSLFILKSVEV